MMTDHQDEIERIQHQLDREKKTMPFMIPSWSGNGVMINWTRICEMAFILFVVSVIFGIPMLIIVNRIDRMVENQVILKQGEFTIVDNQADLMTMIASRMTPPCINCHGHPERMP